MVSWTSLLYLKFWLWSVFLLHNFSVMFPCSVSYYSVRSPCSHGNVSVRSVLHSESAVVLHSLHFTLTWVSLTRFLLHNLTKPPSFSPSQCQFPRLHYNSCRTLDSKTHTHLLSLSLPLECCLLLTRPRSGGCSFGRLQRVRCDCPINSQHLSVRKHQGNNR